MLVYWEISGPECLHEKHTVLGGGVEHRTGVFGTQRQGFLAQDVLAGIQTLQYLLFVKRVRRSNVEGVNGRVGEGIAKIIVAGGRRNVVFLGEFESVGLGS